MSDRLAFEATYGCSNCGAGWSETHPPRTRVERVDTQNAVMVSNTDCDEWGVQACDCCYHVRCPTCELLDTVSVDARAPVEDEDGDGDSDE